MPEQKTLEDVAKKVMLAIRPNGWKRQEIEAIADILRAHCVPRAQADALAEELSNMCDWVDAVVDGTIGFPLRDAKEGCGALFAAICEGE